MHSWKKMIEMARRAADMIALKYEYSNRELYYLVLIQTDTVLGAPGRPS
jgi:hypothetical protein